MIKLLIVLKNYDGGTGTFVRLWKRHYQRQPSHLIDSIQVLSLQKPRLLPSKEIVDDFHSDSNYSQRYHLVQSIVRFWSELRWLYHSINEYRPDIVLSVDSHAIILVELIRIWLRNKFISLHTIHNNLERVFRYRLSNPYKQYLVKVLLRFLLNRSKQVVCISKELSISVKLFLGLHFLPSTIYYGVEQHRASVISNHNKKKTILSIGRFDEQKDFDTLLLAFQRVSLDSEIRLLVIGDGPQRKYLQSQIHKLKIDDKVEILPWKRDLAAYFINADMFILSSNWEGLSFVILEAMSYGLPIIASDCDFGPREILRGERDGLLFPVGNVKELVICIEKVVQKLDWYRGLSLQRIKYFSIDSQIEAYEQTCLKAR